MLAMQVAARSTEVAFAINSSGFMEPLWQTLRYQAKAIPHSKGASQSQITEDSAFVDLWLNVARTGELHCPVLGVFGELDPFTPAQRTT